MWTFVRREGHIEQAETKYIGNSLHVNFVILNINVSILENHLEIIHIRKKAALWWQVYVYVEFVILSAKMYLFWKII